MQPIVYVQLKSHSLAQAMVLALVTNGINAKVLAVKDRLPETATSVLLTDQIPPPAQTRTFILWGKAREDDPRCSGVIPSDLPLPAVAEYLTSRIAL